MKKRIFRFAALAVILVISPVMAYSEDDMQDMVVSEDFTEEYSEDIGEGQDDLADDEYTGLISDLSENTSNTSSTAILAVIIYFERISA